VEAAGAVGIDLGQPALDRGVDVLVAVGEDELTALDLLADLDQGLVESVEAGLAEEPGLEQAAGVGDASGDVKWGELEVDLERA
jgi:hypothetical protein